MQLLGGDHQHLAAFAKEATLSNFGGTHFPPTCIVHGTMDDTVPVEESEYLAAQIRSSGSVCELHLLEGAGHRIDDSIVASLVKPFLLSNLARQ